MPPPGPSPALFFDTVNAYQRTEALRAAVELDLFTHIAAGPPPRSLTPLERTRGASASSPTTSRSSASSTRTATGTSSPRTRPRS